MVGLTAGNRSRNATTALPPDSKDYWHDVRLRRANRPVRRQPEPHPPFAKARAMHGETRARRPRSAPTSVVRSQETQRSLLSSMRTKRTNAGP